MTFKEKLAAMVKADERTGKNSASIGDHLSDEDFIKLIENKPPETNVSPDGNDVFSINDKLAPLRRHLADCTECLDRFQDFYAFYAPAESHENIAGKREIDAAWQAFAPLIKTAERKPNFPARLFPAREKTNYFAAFGWAFAALLLLFTGIAAFIAWQAKNENSQLAEQLERQKQTSEEQLKNLELSAQNRNSTEQEKFRLAAEKEELEKRVAALQTEIERAARQKQILPEIISPPNPRNSESEKPDNSLVAVNTPIYDVFPGDAVVRGENAGQNQLIIPNAAKNIVLILNAVGRADFPAYQAALLNNTGKIVWRGDGLRKDAAGNFTLTLSRAALKTGNFRLKLLSGSQTVAEYPVSVKIGK